MQPRYVTFFQQHFKKMKLEHNRDLTIIGYDLDGKIICAAFVQFIKQHPAPEIAHYCVVYFIHTQEEYRKQGHATRLLGMIAQCMREHNTLRGYGPHVRMIFSHAPRESKGFYKGL